MKKETKKIEKQIEDVWKNRKFDPNGSYVGTGEEETPPVQDQDDL